MCTVDLRRLEYRRLTFAFQRERMGMSPPVATLHPFLTRASVGQQTEETPLYPALRRWRRQIPTGEQWNAASIRTLPSSPGETHSDIGTYVRPANIIADYNMIDIYLRNGQLPFGVTIYRRRSNVYEVYNADNEVPNNIIIVD